MLEAILIIFVWIVGGYFSGGFIIRWNESHLSSEPLDQGKLKLANGLNANLFLYKEINVSHETKISKWRTVLILLGPVTIVKAALLRVRGGQA